MLPLNIPIETLEQGAIIPQYAHEGDAGLDVCSTADITIEPFERVLIPTGLRMAIPCGYGGFVLPRSGLALKKGLSLVNSPGLIDSNYRGEIKIIAINLDPANSIEIHLGDRVAQLVIMKVENVSFDFSHDLSKTVRGSGGFGSSGV